MTEGTMKRMTVRPTAPTMVLVALSVICATAVLAHEGETHVMGTVSAIDAQRVVVTDREGKALSIGLTKDTRYKQGDAPSAASALKVGTRVVVDLAGKPESLTASEIHVAPAAPASAHQGAGPHQGEHDQPHQH